jgi:AcrR family transcriptional regulator
MSKKENILQAALKLFADEGFSATSTSKVAKAAGVSEGLIFRHFKNKEGLLEAILLEGEEKAKQLFADIVFEPDPEKVIQKTLGLGKKFMESKEVADFWKLQYKIKWEIEQYNEQKTEPLELALINAFRKLNYDAPEREARLLLTLLDGMAMRFFLQKSYDLNKEMNYLYLKYKQ